MDRLENHRIGWVMLVVVLTALPMAYGQVSTTGEIRGTVTDPSGAAVPGATLNLLNEAAGTERNVTSSGDGGFVFVRVEPGTYRLTASAKGFQNASTTGLVVVTARAIDVPMKMTLGNVTETIEVQGTGVTLETSSTTIATTVSNELIQALPLNGRNILGFTLVMAGAQRGSSDRNSDFNGLPNASQNITLDGINDNSQRFKSGGTSNFVFAPLRLGAIEEVTVSTTGMGADSTGEGAMQMRFVTRRGTNQFHGSGFEQLRNDKLNANSWINDAAGLSRPILRLNEFGGNFGGPLLKNKIFFFVNHEELRQPSQSAQNTIVLTPEAQTGVFRYSGTDGVQRTVNLLQIAGVAGFPSQIDATMASQFKRMNDALAFGSVSTSDLIRNRLQWNRLGGLTERYPTARADYQITPAISWTGSWNLRWRDIKPTTAWPGPSFPNQSEFISTYFIVSSGVNWSIRPNMFNEFRAGVQGNPEMFNAREKIDEFNFSGRLEQINFPSGFMPLLVRNTLPSPDNNPVYNLYDNLNIVRGRHTLTMGGSLLYTSNWEANFGGGNSGGVPPSIPQLTIGVDSADPIASVLNAANIPSVRSSDLPTAQALYAVLTGRLSNITNSRAVDEKTHQYQDFSPFVRREAMTTWGLYFQDSWRILPTLTLNYGMRWEFTGDNHNTNGIFSSPPEPDLIGVSSRPFTPGVLDGVQNPAIQVRPHVYGSDNVNPAPNFGFAWNPHSDQGMIGKLLGADRKLVVRGSFGLTYYQEGLLPIEWYSSQNPGLTQNLFLSPGQTGFAPGSLSLSGPLPALNTFPTSFSPPFSQSLFTFSGTPLYSTLPNLRSPYVTNWTLGIQRQLPRSVIMEVRYVGNKGTHIWHGFNQNEVNIFENGFLKEFTNAQNNLAINQAAGVSSFANLGRAGQVVLPIFDAAFGARGDKPALAGSQGYTNGTFVTQLLQGQAGALANALTGSGGTYLCRMVGNSLTPCATAGYNAAGPYPINFFQSNPYASGAVTRLMTDYSYSSYNSLQIEFRRSAHGLSIQSSYVLSKSLGDLFIESDHSELDFTTLRNRGMDKGPSVFDIRHVGLAFVNYELPFGSGHRFHGSALVNGILGGWNISSITRIQSGRPFKLTSGRSTFNQNDAGVILNGLTTSQLQDLIGTVPGPNKNKSFVSPSLVGTDGRSNPSLLAPPTTPGQLGQIIFLKGPKYFSSDMALQKEVPIYERLKLEFAVEALNVFNHPVFQVAGATGSLINITSTSFGQTTSVAVPERNVQFRMIVRF
jgi:hypothetical protein